MKNEYLKFITYYLGNDLRFWNYKAGKSPVEVLVFKSRIIDNKQTIYLPCRLKNKNIKIRSC